MFNQIKKIFFQSALVLSAALTAAFVFFGFINTEALERAEAHQHISVAGYVHMQGRINELVAQVMEEE